MALNQARADPQADSQDASGLAAVISNIDEATAKKEKADKEAQAQAETELARASKKTALNQAKADPSVPLSKQAEAQNAGGLAAVISNIDEAKAKKEKAEKEAQAHAETELARVSKKTALNQASADPSVPLSKQAEAQNAGGLAAVISNIDEAKAKKENAEKDAQAQAETELARVSKKTALSQ